MRQSDQDASKLPPRAPHKDKDRQAPAHPKTFKKLAHTLVHTSTWDFAGGGAPKRRMKFRNGDEYLRRTTKKWPDSKVRVWNTQPTYIMYIIYAL